MQQTYQDTQQTQTTTSALVQKFETTLRMYKYVVNNPKYYDRDFHLREINNLEIYLRQIKKELTHESSNN